MDAAERRFPRHLWAELMATASKRGRGRPRLTEGEKPVRVEVLLSRTMADQIKALGVKRSTFAREAIAEKLERESAP